MAKLAIVGASGAVGQTVLERLERRGTKLDTLRLVGDKSAGRSLDFRNAGLVIESIDKFDFSEVDFAIVSAGKKVSLGIAERLAQAGCVMIDNSSAFRLKDGVPLVGPMLSPDAAILHHGLIAVSNCTSAVTYEAVGPLHREFGLLRMSAASYQAASGAGARGRTELYDQTAGRMAGRATGNAWMTRIPRAIFKRILAWNVLAQIGDFRPNGYTDEEMKLPEEGRKMLGDDSIRVSATCVRVPTDRVHCIDVMAEFEKPLDMDRVREVLRSAPGLVLLDDTDYPTPLDYADRDECAVGRLRRDIAFDNALRFFVGGDQLLRGAALPAIEAYEACTG